MSRQCERSAVGLCVLLTDSSCFADRFSHGHLVEVSQIKEYIEPDHGYNKHLFLAHLVLRSYVLQLFDTPMQPAVDTCQVLVVVVTAALCWRVAVWPSVTTASGTMAPSSKSAPITSIK